VDHAPARSALRIVVLSTRLSESRRAAFRALTRDLGEPRFVGPAEPVPDAAEWDAVVVDGRQPARPLEALAAMRAAVERGAALVAVGGAPGERDGFWADLLGGRRAGATARRVRGSPRRLHISDRVTRESAVDGSSRSCRDRPAR
jgi:hypothetical protein